MIAAIYARKSADHRERIPWRKALGLSILALTAAPSAAMSQDVRSGVVTISSMKREFDTVGDIVYELRLKRAGGAGFYSVTASKPGGPCEGFFVGDDDVPATHTASTITLTKGKSVCRLTIRRMF
jgi:hypothetical protein